jgi:hypothetical protein
VAVPLLSRHLKKEKNERIAAEKAAAAAEEAEKKRIAAEKQKAEAERIAAEKAAAAAEEAEKKRIAAERKLAKQERIAAEKVAAKKKAEEEEAARVARENARLVKRRLEEEARERKKAEEEEASRVAREKARLEKKRLEEEEKAHREQEKRDQKRRKDEEEWKRKRERDAEKGRERERVAAEKEKEREREAAEKERQARGVAILETWLVIRQTILRGLSLTKDWKVVLLLVVAGAAQAQFQGSQRLFALIAEYGDTFWQSVTILVGFCAVAIACVWLTDKIVYRLRHPNETLMCFEFGKTETDEALIIRTLTTGQVIFFIAVVVVVGGFSGGYASLMAVITGTDPEVVFRQVGAFTLVFGLSMVSMSFAYDSTFWMAATVMLQAIIRGPEGFGLGISVLVMSKREQAWEIGVLAVCALVAVYLGPERFMAFFTDSEGPLEFFQYENFVFGHAVRAILMSWTAKLVSHVTVIVGARINFLQEARDMAQVAMLLHAVAAFITPGTSIGHTWALVADKTLFRQDAVFFTFYFLAMVVFTAARGTNYWIVCMAMLIQLATTYRGAIGLGLATSVLASAADSILVTQMATSSCVALLVLAGAGAFLDGNGLVPVDLAAFWDLAIAIVACARFGLVLYAIKVGFGVAMDAVMHGYTRSMEFLLKVAGLVILTCFFLSWDVITGYGYSLQQDAIVVMGFFLSALGYCVFGLFTGDILSGWIALLGARALGMDVIPTGHLGIGITAMFLFSGFMFRDVAVICSALYVIGRKSALGA